MDMVKGLINKFTNTRLCIKKDVGYSEIVIYRGLSSMIDKKIIDYEISYCYIDFEVKELIIVVK